MKWIYLILTCFLVINNNGIDSQGAQDPWYMKIVKIIQTSPSPEVLTQNLIKFFDSEKIDGLPFNPTLAKGFLLTTDIKLFIEQGVDFVKLAGLLQPGDKTAVVINAINFDVLQRSLNLTAFFSYPNVTEIIRKAGISPELLQAFMMNVNFKTFVDAVPIEKVIQLYSPNNTATTMEKAKTLAKLINAKKLVNSINWRRLQSDENFLNIIDNALSTQSSVDPELVKALLVSIDLHQLMTKGVKVDRIVEAFASNSTNLPSAVLENIDFNEAFEVFNVTVFLSQPNITQTLRDNKIDPNLVKILVHVNMTGFAVGTNLGGILKAYATGDNSTRQDRLVSAIEKMDNDKVVNSVNWNTLKADRSFTALLSSKVPNYLNKVIISGDIESMAKGVDFKGLAKELVMTTDTNPNFLSLITKYVKTENLIKSIDLGLLIQTYLKANTTLKISKTCQQAFADMAFPLPNLADMPPGFGALERAKHPIIQLIDSWSKVPPGIFLGRNHWLGAPDQCKGVSNAKYCFANMDMGKLDPSLGGGTFGFCLPKPCSEKDGQNIIEFFFKEYLTDSIKFEYRTWNPTRPLPVNCEKEEEIPYTRGFKVAMAITGILMALAFIGTLADEMYVWSKKHEEAEYEDEKKTEEKSKKIQDPLLVRILQCFSIPRNVKGLMSTYMPKGAVGSINGIKVISLWWVIVGHTYANLNGSFMDNKIAVKNVVHRYSSLVIMNAYPCVDVFWLIGGLLVSYLSLKRMDKTGGRLDLLMYYLHRFLRITPMFMFIILFTTNVIPAFKQRYDTLGIFENPIGGQETCQKYWWTNFLYIHNFYPKSFWRSCHPVSWYLANDMQFYIVSPLFLYLIYHLEKRWKNSKLRYWSGPIVLLTGVFMCFCVTVALIDYNNYPAMHAAYQLRWLLKPNPRANVRLDPQDETYDKPYTRIAPYLIGMLVGYMFSRKLELKHKYKKGINVVLWIAALVTGYLCVYGPSSMYKEKPVFFNDSENLAFGSLHIIAWSLSVGWVIYSCHYGMGGLINDFLSWKAWIPLSRLSLGVYLLHGQVIGYFLNRFHNGYHYKDSLFTFDFTSIVIVSTFFSFLVSILVELPLFNLEKMFLR